MAAFDQSSFARAVQKREAKKSSSRSHSKSSSTTTTTSVFRRKDNNKNDKENIFSSKKDNKSGKENSCSEMTMKKKLLGKLFKILTLKESSKKCTKEEKKLCHTRRRSRSSQSSTPSNFEPMPTIYEDDEESDLISLQSFCIHKQTYNNMTVAVA